MNAGAPASVERLRRLYSGVTLMEVMAVVAIMGILSGLGVAGLRSAVANARIKDAAYNVTAFMERTANEARRLNTTLCVVKVDNQTLATYKAKCTDANKANNGLTAIDVLKLEAPNKFLGDSELKNIVDLGSTNFAGNGADFIPRTGLSAAPSAGFFAVQYGTNTSLRAAAAKVSTKNAFVPKVSYDGSNWTDI